MENRAFFCQDGSLFKKIRRKFIFTKFGFMKVFKRNNSSLYESHLSLGGDLFSHSLLFGSLVHFELILLFKVEMRWSTSSNISVLKHHYEYKLLELKEEKKVCR